MAPNHDLSAWQDAREEALRIEPTPLDEYVETGCAEAWKKLTGPQEEAK